MPELQKHHVQIVAAVIIAVSSGIAVLDGGVGGSGSLNAILGEVWSLAFFAIVTLGVVTFSKEVRPRTLWLALIALPLFFAVGLMNRQHQLRGDAPGAAHLETLSRSIAEACRKQGREAASCEAQARCMAMRLSVGRSARELLALFDGARVEGSAELREVEAASAACVDGAAAP